MKTKRIWGAAMALLMLALPAAAQQAAAPVKVGVIGPFSGPSSDFGVPMLQGVELAVEQINAVGGYLGRPLALVVKDDQGNPDVGRKGSEELVAQGVAAIVHQAAKLPLRKLKLNESKRSLDPRAVLDQSVQVLEIGADAGLLVGQPLGAVFAEQQLEQLLQVLGEILLTFEGA